MTSQPLRSVPDPSPTTEPDFEQLVKRWTELRAKAEEITAEQSQIKERLEQLVEVGTTVTSTSGVKVSVQGPSRRFDVKAAVELLKVRDASVLDRCRSDGYDAKKVRAQLTGEEEGWAMVAGTGANIVKIT